MFLNGCFRYEKVQFKWSRVHDTLYSTVYVNGPSVAAKTVGDKA